jgi:DNA-binding response OmpR family regulator
MVEIMAPNKVMLIEDDETMLSLITTLLEFEGFQVSQLEKDGCLEDILDCIRHEKPELILLDVHLRRTNGFDLLERMRQDEELKSTRVLMSSGMELSKQCDQGGADGFILKPYMPEELVGKIRSFLG